MADAMKKVTDATKSAASATSDAVKGAAEWTSDSTKKAATATGDAAKGAYQGATDATKNAATATSDAAKGAVKGAQDSMERAASATSEGVKGAAEWTSDSAKKVATATSDAAKGAVQGATDSTKNAAKATSDAAEGAAAKFDGGPHLESLDRVCHMPVVHSAIEMTGSTYAYVKESSDLLNWALNYVESGLQYASATAAPIATPIVKKLEGPINAVDQTLCKGLDMVGQTVTTAKEQPQHISDAAKAVMSSSVTPALEKLTAVKDSATQRASSLKDSALNKADELLNTQFGSMAVQGVDTGSAAVNRLLDRYFPAVVGAEDVVPAPISPEENKVLHTVQTVGQLSTKTARRVYHSIAAQLKTVKKEDVTAYMNSVVSILHLTKLLGSDKETSDEEGLASGSPDAEKKDDETEVKEKK